MNVDTTFLNPTYEEEIYIEILEYFYLVNLEITKDTHYMRLLKSLYRLKQALRVWFEIVKSFFHKIRLKVRDSDLNLFLNKGVYILLFIDDMLIIRNHIDVDKIK